MENSVQTISPFLLSAVNAGNQLATPEIKGGRRSIDAACATNSNMLRNSVSNPPPCKIKRPQVARPL